MNKFNALVNGKEFKILIISISHSVRYSNAGVDQLIGYLREQEYTVDVKYYHEREQDIEALIRDVPLDYNLYGFSVYSANYLKCCKVCEYIKKNNRNAIVYFGGAFPTMYYNDIFNECEVLDYIILGDGEKPTELLVDHIMNHSEENLDSESIVTRIDKLNKKPYCNTEILHKPIYDYYENDTKEKNIRKIHCLQTKNNVCTGNCSFCFERKGRIVYKDLDQIVDEISFIAKNYGIRKFYFADDNLLDPNNRIAKERIKELCYKIKDLNMKLVFTCFIKAISFNNCKLDNELLQLMSEAGFATIFIGIESGNETDLLLYNKHTTVEDNYTIIRLLENHDIIPMIGFINFNPYSTMGTLQENHRFLINIKSINLFHYVCAFLNVYKNTDIYMKMKADGLLKSTYSMLNDLDYIFIDKNVNNIVCFIRENMVNRIKKLDIELDWVIQYYSECKRINPEANKFETELYEYKVEQFEIVKEYFGELYIKNDIEKCKDNVENFLIYFENIQPRLLIIYKELIKLYNS